MVTFIFTYLLTYLLTYLVTYSVRILIISNPLKHLQSCHHPTLCCQQIMLVSKFDIVMQVMFVSAVDLEAFRNLGFAGNYL